MSTMELVIRPRQGGKTTEVLRLAAAHFAYIVVPTRQDVDRLWAQARKLQLDIPQPITWDEFAFRSNSRLRGRRIKAFVIDDLDRCIQQTAGMVPVVAASLSGNIIEPEKPEPPGMISDGIVPDSCKLSTTGWPSPCTECRGPVEYWITTLGKGWVHVGPERGYVLKDHRPEPEA